MLYLSSYYVCNSQTLVAVTMYIGSVLPNKPAFGEMSLPSGAVQPPGNARNQRDGAGG